LLQTDNPPATSDRSEGNEKTVQRYVDWEAGIVNRPADKAVTVTTIADARDVQVVVTAIADARNVQVVVTGVVTAFADDRNVEVGIATTVPPKVAEVDVIAEVEVIAQIKVSGIDTFKSVKLQLPAEPVAGVEATAEFGGERLFVADCGLFEVEQHFRCQYMDEIGRERELRST